MARPEDVGREGPRDVGRNRAGHVGVDAEQLGRRLRADHVGDLRAPIAALRDVPRVPEAPHQDDPRVRDVDGIPALRRRLGGEPVAGHRRDHHVERVVRAAAVRRRVGERADHAEHLDDRARPAVRDDHRQRVGVRRPDVDEVDVEAVDLGHELRDGVEPRLEPAEVVVVGPVPHERLHRRERDALRQVADGLLLGPARRLESSAQVIEVALRHLHPERTNGLGSDGVRVLGGCSVRHLLAPMASRPGIATEVPFFPVMRPVSTVRWWPAAVQMARIPRTSGP